MKRDRAIEHPHPVLNEYSDDFVDSSFSVSVVDHSDSDNTITFDLECELKCDGIINLLSQGLAKIAVRLICARTSYRTTFDAKPNTITRISIPKKNVAGAIDIQAIIVAANDLPNYSLPEFNREIFGNAYFKLRKGDIIADEPGLVITLDTVLEKNVGGIVFVNTKPSVSEMRVSFAKVDETNPELTDYIYITIPEDEYKRYAELRTKKHLKHGIERFLQSAIILPAITEAIARLRIDEMLQGGEYRGTIWAESIYKSLATIGINDLADCELSDYVLANRLLGDVVNDAISDLMLKMNEWSTIRQEDDV